MAKLHNVQILRGLLFIGILLFHASAPFARIMWGGVESFFVISAFFATKSFIIGSKPTSISRKFKERIKRLYPPYLVLMIVVTVLALILHTVPWDIFFHIPFLQNFLWMVTDYCSPLQPFTAHTWTMTIEVVNGLILLFCFKISGNSRKGLIRILYLLLGIGIVYRCIMLVFSMRVMLITLCPVGHLDAFAFGGLVASDIYFDHNSGKKTTRKYKYFLFSLIGIIGILLCWLYLDIANNMGFLEAYNLFGTARGYMNNLLSGNIYLFIDFLTIGLLNICIITESGTVRKSVLGLLEKLGNISYEAYLFHWPILVIVKHIVNNWVALSLVTFVITVISSIVFDTLMKRARLLIRENEK